jgi:hypothetical protein
MPPQRKRQRRALQLQQKQSQRQHQQVVPELSLVQYPQAIGHIYPQLVGEHLGFLRQIDGFAALQLRVDSHEYMSKQHSDRYTPGLKLIINTKDIVLPGGDYYEQLTVIPEHCSITFTVARRTDQRLVFRIQHAEFKIQDPKRNHNVEEAKHIELIEYAETGGDITIQFNTTAASYKQLATAIRAEDESATQGTMTFEIHFERVGAVKFTAPFIWKSHAKFKTVDAAAKAANTTDHLHWQLEPEYLM